MARIFAGCLYVWALAGCTFNPNSAAFDENPGLADGGGGGGADGALDGAPADAAESCPGDVLPFAMLNIEPCDLPETSEGDVSLSAAGVYFFNTGTGVLQDPNGVSTPLGLETVTQSDGSELLLWSVDDFELASGSRLVVYGPRPLVLVAYSDIIVEGMLAARGQGEIQGAGGNLDGSCGDGRGPAGVVQTDGNGNAGGSGGGGGAFGAAGGTGGIVETSGGAVTGAGQAALDRDLVPLRGGCAGGLGGDSQGGIGGFAGGAIQLIAGGTVRIDGRFTASGGGGAGAGDHGGGGGGGSGGGLLVQSTNLLVGAGAVITANGGGGGEGSRTFNSNPGNDGREGSAEVAVGGSGGSFGGNGGNGGVRDIAATEGVEGSRSSLNAAGGGGGGGSVGVIRLLATSPTIADSAVISPAAQLD